MDNSQLLELARLAKLPTLPVVPQVDAQPQWILLAYLTGGPDPLMIMMFRLLLVILSFLEGLRFLATNHPRYPPPTPFTRRLSHLVDWDVPRRKGPFATLTTVLLRIRVFGNSDRAIDLKELWLDHKPTGGGPT